MKNITKKTNNFIKGKEGSTFTLVLIMGFVVIVLTLSMVGYVFRDIGFTELDEDNSKAFNLAESGISNMFYYIDQYNQGIIEEIPGEYIGDETYSYDEDVKDEESGEVVGDFTIEYQIVGIGWEELLRGYNITSTGREEYSDIEKTVEVSVLSLNVYNLIFSGEAMGASQIAGNTNITGPLFVDGDFGLLLGNSSFLGGPLFVKGDLDVSGSSSIGSIDEPIILFLGGNLNGSEYDPINPPSNVYVSYFYDTVLDIELPVIDDAYINSLVAAGALVINGDLYIGDEVIELNGAEVAGGYPGYLEFIGGVLEIDKNTVVYGDIEIGDSTGPKYTIGYSGKANMVSTGSITVGSQIVANNMAEYPTDSLLVLLSKNNISFDLTNQNGGTFNDPSAAVMIIANGTIDTSTDAFIRGSCVSDVLIMGQNTHIYYEPGIADELRAVPGLDSGIFTLEWQEIIEPES
jgi:hypothetical protein